MASLRFFIAIETPPEIKAQIGDIISQLQTAGADVRWEMQEKLHITLKFLGDTPEELLPQIVLLLEGVAQKTPAFAIRYSGLGCFPHKHDPRIVWVGVDDAVVATVQHLAALIDTELASIGIEKKEDFFHPHITIGRVKSRKNPGSLLRTMQSITFESQPTTITEILIIKSELRPSGSIYQLVKAFQLRGIR